jgi:hypothetical protein
MVSMTTRGPPVALALAVGIVEALHDLGSGIDARSCSLDGVGRFQ